MRITQRLLLLVSVPLAVAVTFSGLALAPATGRAIDAHRLTEMVEAADSASDLLHKLQRERDVATALATDQPDVPFVQSTAATDASVTRFREQRDDLSAVPDSARAALDRIEGSLAALASLRAQARSGSSTLSALAFRYRIVIADLIAYREGIAQADGVEAGVADRIRASAALSRAAEHLSRQQVTVTKALEGGGFTPSAQRAFDATRLGYRDAIRVMFDLGPPEWRSLLERTLSGPEALAAKRLEDQVGRMAVNRKLGLTTKKWRSATSDRLELLWSVEDKADESVLGTVTSARTELVWWTVGEVFLVVLMLVAAVVFATRLGHGMSRRLRELANAARHVAKHGLPEVMRELAQPGALSGRTPEQVAEHSGSPVATTGRDEIGEVGEAFNAVHYEAVRLAAQRTHSHERFAETLVSVARRGAQLTSVMVSELDAVQRDESDPKRMQVLFALDHLAIRMDRNTNSLLVLGGHGQGRVRSADAPCSSVIVAAAQQIERYGRVSVGVVEDGILIAARAVHDLAHLLAELLDNATRYSPPDTDVGIAAWRLFDRVVVAIVDEGVGIPDDRRAALNAELAEPRTDVGGVRTMGLQVVSQLAARYGIVVELRDSSGHGTIAEVTLPASLLAESPRRTSRAEDEPFDGFRPRTARRFAPRPTGQPGKPEPVTPQRVPQPVRTEPAERVTGVSAAGLPMRNRQSGDSRGSGDGPSSRPATPPKPPPSRRDSRQVSDVLTAYAQGINRSASRTGRKPPGSGL